MVECPHLLRRVWRKLGFWSGENGVAFVVSAEGNGALLPRADFVWGSMAEVCVAVGMINFELFS